jgi:hypothetical protein
VPSEALAKDGLPVPLAGVAAPGLVWAMATRSDDYIRCIVSTRRVAQASSVAKAMADKERLRYLAPLACRAEQRRRPLTFHHFRRERFKHTRLVGSYRFRQCPVSLKKSPRLRLHLQNIGTGAR